MSTSSFVPSHQPMSCAKVADCTKNLTLWMQLNSLAFLCWKQCRLAIWLRWDPDDACPKADVAASSSDQCSQLCTFGAAAVAVSCLLLRLWTQYLGPLPQHVTEEEWKACRTDEKRATGTCFEHSRHTWTSADGQERSSKGCQYCCTSTVCKERTAADKPFNPCAPCMRQMRATLAGPPIYCTGAISKPHGARLQTPACLSCCASGIATPFLPATR